MMIGIGLLSVCGFLRSAVISICGVVQVLVEKSDQVQTQNKPLCAVDC